MQQELDPFCYSLTTESVKPQKKKSGSYVYLLDYKKVNEYLKQKGYVEEKQEIEEENVESDEDY